MELGKVKLRNEQSIQEIRTKVMTVCQTLGMSQSKSTRMAVLASESARMLNLNYQPKVTFYLMPKYFGCRFELLFEHLIDGGVLALKDHAGNADELFYNRGEKHYQIIIANSMELTGGLRPELGEKLIEIVAEASREELMEQLAEKNAQLQDHLDQLEDIVEARTSALNEANLTLQRKELQSRLLKNIATVANSAQSQEQVLQAGLDIICQYTEWPIAHAYLTVYEGGEAILKPTEIWHMSNNSIHRAFKELTMKSSFKPGKGMPGRVFLERQPLWVEDIPNKDSFVRAELARKSNLNSFFGFPVIVQDGVEAVLEFFSCGETTPSCHQLFEFVQEVADTIGTYFGRRKVQAALEKAEQDAQALAELREAASQSKSDFLANMSHEIRTPMNAIIGMTYLTLQTSLNAKQKDYVGKTLNAANSLLGLINDILDFSKIEAGKMDMETINFHLHETADNLTSLMMEKIRDKGLEFLHFIPSDVPNGLVGDPLRLGQVLTNLVSNAIKFTETGEVLLNIEVVERSNDKVKLQFTCKDSGIGMSEEQIAKLFQSFSQADASTTRKYGGTGLGLTICKKLVELMNGEIWVESEQGKGSSFIFTAEFGMHDAASPILAPVTDLRGIKVLVVDDSPASLQILEHICLNLSFEVCKVNSGEQALIEIEQADQKDEPFKLIYMDWKMLGMSGLEATEQIKHKLKLQHPPKVVMVTSYDREEMVKMAGDITVDGFLTKPVVASCLLDAAMVAFGHSSQDAPKQVSLNLGKEAVAGIQGAKILLVEDNEVNQQVATELLEQALLLVDIADNGQIALDKVNQNSYDAVLMDIQMPVMDGFTASTHIRKNPAHKALPIIAMTANAMEGDRERCIDSGMNDHVAKPINPQALYEALAKWVEEKTREIPVYEHQNTTDLNDQAEPFELPHLAGIDTDEGLSHMGGSIKTYIRVLKTFVDHQQHSVDELQQAIDKKDKVTAERIAHTIRGVAGNIGAISLQSMATIIEKQQQNDEKTTVNDINALSQAMNTVLSGITNSQLLSAAQQQLENAGANGSKSLKELLPKLEELLELLDDYDMDAQELLDEVLSEMADAQLSKQLELIRKPLGDYDFELAAENLREVMDTAQIN